MNSTATKTLPLRYDGAGIKDAIRNSSALKPSHLKISDLNWRFAVRSVLRGENLLILGESGFGKTLLAMTLPEVLGRPFYNIPMGHGGDPKSLLIGNTHYSKGQGTFVADAPFVEAIQTPYAIILLDELSRAHPTAHNILMPVLDKKQRRLLLDSKPDAPNVPVAEGVTFIATANVGSEYTATRTLDRALLDRFFIMLMPMLSKTDEVALLSEMFPELSQYSIGAIAEIAETTRQQVKSEEPKVTTAVSTRITVMMAALMCDGFTLAEAAEICVYPFFSDAGGTDSERTFMIQQVQQYAVDDDVVTTPNPSAWKPTAGVANPNGAKKSPFPV